MAYSRPLDVAQQMQAFNGSPRYLGTITGTVSTNNSTTSVPFVIPAGSVLMLQADSTCVVIAGTTTATAVTTGTGVTIVQNEKFIISLDPALSPVAEQWVAMLPSTGTTNVKVFAMS